MKYDIIVIGAGAAGLNIAVFMNRVGFKTLMIDKTDKNIGGDCLNFGCVPSKALIHVSKIINDSKISKEFGLKSNGKVDMKKVKDYIKSKQEFIRVHENADYFRKQGMDVILGEAKFNSKNSVVVDGKEYFGKKIVIATGGKPRKLKIPGIEKLKNVYNNENIFDIEKIPKNFLFIGGGPIGMELGQAFQRLGSNVTVVFRGDIFLPKEEPEISKVLHKQLEKEGMKFLFNCAPLKFTSKNEIIAKHEKGKEYKSKFDAVFIGIGREVNLGLDLEKAGIELTEDKRKIKVNKYLQTTNKKVFVSGDAAGSYQFTHATELHAKLILHNFFSPFKKKLNYDNFSWVTFTDPEIATFGLNKRELESRKIKYEKLEINYDRDDRAIVDNATNGKMILYVSKDNKLLGGSVIGKNAGETFQELALANSSNLDIKHIFNKIYPYPTASTINRKLISSRFKNKLTPLVKRFMKFVY